MSYLLKTSFHQYEFQKHLNFLFTSKPSSPDGNCGYHSILNSFKSSQRCKTTYNCYSLRKDMFEKLSSQVFISILKNSLVHLNDLNEDKLSQSVSFTTQLENIRSNIFDESFTPKNIIITRLYGLICQIVWQCYQSCIQLFLFIVIQNQIMTYTFTNSKRLKIKQLLNGQIYTHLLTLTTVFVFYTKIIKPALTISKP